MMEMRSMSKENALFYLRMNNTREGLVKNLDKLISEAKIEFANDEDFVVVVVGDLVGVAKRAKKDKFDFKIGFSIALVRAVTGKEHSIDRREVDAVKIEEKRAELRKSIEYTMLRLNRVMRLCGVNLLPLCDMDGLIRKDILEELDQIEKCPENFLSSGILDKYRR